MCVCPVPVCVGAITHVSTYVSVLQIVEGASSIDDENREEVDEDETTAATASSFTNRETPMRWKPHDIIKFYRVSAVCHGL